MTKSLDSSPLSTCKQSTVDQLFKLMDKHSLCQAARMLNLDFMVAKRILMTRHTVPKLSATKSPLVTSISQRPL